MKKLLIVLALLTSSTALCTRDCDRVGLADPCPQTLWVLDLMSIEGGIGMAAHDELGIIYPSCNGDATVDPFWEEGDVTITSQVNNDVIRSLIPLDMNYCTATNAQYCPFMWMSYQIDDDQNSPSYPFEIDENEWHRIKITWDAENFDGWDQYETELESIYYYKYENPCATSGTADYVLAVRIYGVLEPWIALEGWHEACVGDYTWANVLTDDPTESDWIPPGPTNLSKNGALMSWQHTWEANVPETQYRVYKSTSPSTKGTLYSTTSSLNKSANTTAFYRVYTYLDGVESDNYAGPLKVVVYKEH